MEYLNKIELQGIVGYCKSKELPDTTEVRFSLVTELNRQSEGYNIIETNWFDVIAMSNKSPAVLLMQKGDAVRVEGRLRTRACYDRCGDVRPQWEVIASKVEILPKED